jgi:hypothetical protein
MPSPVARDRPRFQLSVASLLTLVACAAVNLWLFRLGPLLGLVGLNISKHVVIACLCQRMGVDRERAPQRAHVHTPAPAQVPVP